MGPHCSMIRTPSALALKITLLSVLLCGLAFLGFCAEPDSAPEKPARQTLEVRGGPLRLAGDAYPRAFFFRRSESQAGGGKLTFQEWEESFRPLMGIMGKALDEEVPGRSHNIGFFTRFKQAHPDQAVLLHFNGNARDPRWESQRFFAGHWLYFNGAKVLSAASPDERESVLQVSDASLFETGAGRYRNSNDDIGLCVLGADGRPDWNESEQVQLLSVDRGKNTIRVRRGCYGTKARAFPAGKAYAAAHCTEGPFGKDSNTLWFYNYSATCPKDARGQSCADVLVTHLGEIFGSGGPLAAFDGLEFDVLNNVPGGGRPRSVRGPDCDADGAADGGVVSGANVYGAGVIEFCRQLRSQLGEGRIIMADGATKRNTSQRAFGILNGIESEGWPHLSDHEIRDWSGGLNRHFFWGLNARQPAFNYINHKFVNPGVGSVAERQPEVPFHIHRLVFAAAVFTDSAICYSYPPPGGDERAFPIWDEFVMGAENRPGWLGKPIGPAVRLAAREPDLLGGKGKPIRGELLRRFESDEARMEFDQGAVKLTAKNPEAAQFRVRLKDVPCAGPDLFVLVSARAGPMRKAPAEMARQMHLGIASPAESGPDARAGRPGKKSKDEPPGEQFTTWVNTKEFTSGFYFNDVRPPKVDLELVMESAEPVWISAVTAHASPDAMFREFEHGLVVANPSPRPYTFDLAKLFPGGQFRRLTATPQQDPIANNGGLVGESLTLGPQEGLFLRRENAQSIPP